MSTKNTQSHIIKKSHQTHSGCCDRWIFLASCLFIALVARRGQSTRLVSKRLQHCANVLHCCAVNGDIAKLLGTAVICTVYSSKVALLEDAGVSVCFNFALAAKEIAYLKMLSLVFEVYDVMQNSALFSFSVQTLSTREALCR